MPYPEPVGVVCTVPCVPSSSSEAQGPTAVEIRQLVSQGARTVLAEGASAADTGLYLGSAARSAVNDQAG